MGSNNISNNISNKQDTYSEDFFVKMDRKEKEKKPQILHLKFLAWMTGYVVIVFLTETCWEKRIGFVWTFEREACNRLFQIQARLHSKM